MSKKNKKNNFVYGSKNISWLGFDGRILEEANDLNHPVMERAKFLGITASNLDEFFMVKIANLIHKIDKNSKKRDISGLKPKKEFKILVKKMHKFVKKQYACYKGGILPSFGKHGIKFLSIGDLDDSQRLFLKNYFKEVISPVLTPIAIDVGRPFPFITGRVLNVAVELDDNEHHDLFGVLQIPSILQRYIRLPGENLNHFVFIEDVICSEINNIFELYNVKSTRVFRVTRNSDLDVSEETNNLMQEVKKTITKRKRGSVVRLEISDNGDKKIKNFLTKKLKISKKDTYKVNGPLDLSFLTKFFKEEWNNSLKFTPARPVFLSKKFTKYKDVFESLRAGDRLVYHPYDSFDAITNFVHQAAIDPNVVSIKQTLYRVSSNSPVIDALIEAVENGKQVTTFVELKARFDEENNILWAKKLENSGCHVIHGLPNCKIHCKTILVVRKEGSKFRRYVHLGTGNYNDITSQFYTDLGLFTCNKKICEDVSSVFNFLTGYSDNSQYKRLVVSPNGTRKFFIDMIDNEIKNVKNGLKGKIIIKVNSITDKEMIDKLYEASIAGVKVRLIVRTTSCLISGIEGISDNIKVISVIGRLLEHSRIFYFENGGEFKIYAGSADLMERNLDKRVEIIFPIEDKDLKNRVFKMLKLMLDDNVNVREQDSKGKFHIRKMGQKIIDSQMDPFSFSER